MTEMPPGRPSEPRTGPAAPAPAHGDDPTGPSTPTGRTELRDRIAEALTREHYRRARERIEASPEDHCAAFADAILPVIEAETAALRERIEEVEDQRDQALAWQDTAERELRNAERRLDAAERIAAALEAERDKARDAIADERRGRLAAEAAVRRVRLVCMPPTAPDLRTEVLAALDAERTEEENR